MLTAPRLAAVIFLLGFWLPADVPGQQAATATGRGDALRQLAVSLGADLDAEEPIKCGFPLLVSARRQLPSLPPEVRPAVNALLARPVAQTSILRFGYRVHFDTIGINVPALLDAQGQRIPGTALAFAESTAASLAYVEAVEVAQLGYSPPVGDGVEGGGPEPDVYIQELYNSYGMTNSDINLPPGGRSPGYVTIDNDFSFVRPAANRGIPALKVTIAHEYHHLLQIGNYGLWPADIYFYEITSTWLEDVVYTEVNDYYNYLRASGSQFRTPDVTFTHANNLIEYSRAVWGHFVAKSYGPGMMRRSWEYIREKRPLEAIDAALREAGSGFAPAFAEWGRWNYYTGSRADPAKYYPEGSSYPEIVQGATDFVPPSTTIAGSVQPAGARYHQVMIPRSPGAFDTLSISAVNCDLSGALVPSPLTQAYVLTIRADQPDATYKETGAGVFAKFSTGNPPLWSVWFFVGRNSFQPFGAGSLKEGTAFPNPWMADGHTPVAIPVDGSTPLTGTLQVYDASMRLVYASEERPLVGTSRQLCIWDGTTNDGNPVASGVYVYLLSLSDGRAITGKFAVLHR